MKEIRVVTVYKNCILGATYESRYACIFFDAQAAEAYAEKERANEQTVQVWEEVSDDGKPYYVYHLGIATLYTDFTGVVKVGEIITDAYKNTTRTCYALPENVDAAKEAISIANGGARKTADAYYAQPWV